MLTYIKYILAVTFLVALCSCTLKKRVYRDGYYISFNAHNSSKKPQQKENAIGSQTGIQASLNNSFSELTTKQNTFGSDSTRCGDTLFLRSGTKYIVKIIELTETEIKIKRCADKAGNVLSFALEDVDRVVDIDGKLVTKQDKEKDKKKAIEKRKTEVSELKKDKTYRDKNVFASFTLLALLLSLFVVALQIALDGSLFVALPIFAVFIFLAIKFKDTKLSFIKIMLHKQDPNVARERSRVAALFFFIGICFIASLLLFYDAAVLQGLIVAFFFFELLALFFSVKSLRSPNREQGKELASTILILSVLASVAAIVALILLGG
jgi:hypothetical protein